MSNVTRILTAIEWGDVKATEELLPAVYSELRRLAAAKLAREKSGQTLQPTALVHEAYLRLIGGSTEVHWDGRGHFFAAAAEAMRRILIEQARRKQRIKHGGDWQRVDLGQSNAATEPESIDLIALDEALTRFATEDKIKADLVQLRFFAGLTIEQAAELLDISKATADRYWAYARAWLYSEITKGD